jgi:hypothetical protein
LFPETAPNRHFEVQAKLALFTKKSLFSPPLAPNQNQLLLWLGRLVYRRRGCGMDIDLVAEDASPECM